MANKRGYVYPGEMLSEEEWNRELEKCLAWSELDARFQKQPFNREQSRKRLIEQWEQRVSLFDEWTQAVANE